jgi:predicted ATPase/class 3 adenylate cyclase
MDAANSPPTGTVTFLFTDIEGSTQLWEQDPEAMRQALARHDVLLSERIQRHGGLVVKSRGEGDSLFAVFTCATEALSAACALQRSLLAESWPTPTPLRVRVAVHTGEAERRDEDYYGPALNRCARLRAAAHGGQVLLSRATQELVRDHLPVGVSLRDLGSHRLKDLQLPEQIFQLLHHDLPANFPPLRSLEAFAHNLPRQLTRFIGREREMAEVKRLLATTALLTLTGAGGCGKTRLSLQVAADLLEEYADGVWLVELAALTDPALVLQTVASTLGVREERARPLAQTLVDHLRSKSLLLVLDNCEHLLAACAELVEALLRSCSSLCILASSRESLGIAGETSYQVPSLSLPDLKQLPPAEALIQFEAARLFADRATAALPAFRLTEQNATAVARVCSQLDGIPLAIELAAARVKVLPVAKIAERLDDRFRLLTGGSRTALPRQQTLRALIDWSYDLLSENERALLRRLSVFAGGWTLEAAETVCAGEGIEPGEVLELLTALVEKSLVLYEPQRADARYRLLETVRQYSRDRLLESGESESVRGRHLDFVLSLFERAEPLLLGPEQIVWLDRLEAEHDNLRAALEWAGATQGEAQLRLAGAALWFWEMRSHYAEGRQWFQQALQHAVQGPTAVQAKAFLGAGTMAWHQGDRDAAEPLNRQALELYRQTDDLAGTALALIGLGVAVGRNRDPERFTALTEEGLAVAQEARAMFLVGAALNNLGRYEECLALSRAGGYQHLTLHALGNLGDDALQQADYEAAAGYAREALETLLQTRDKRLTAQNLGTLAAVSEVQGDWRRATVLLGASDALREAIGLPLPAAKRDEQETRIGALREALGEEAFSAAWAAGRAMSLEDAVAVALEDGSDG